MAIHEHNEIEAKLDATGVDLDAFRVWCGKKLPTKYEFVQSPDHYYINGNGSAVRHRVNSETSHELTVKMRKSDKSTRDRVEIDLKFAEATKPGDVHQFLTMIGYTQEFTLTKMAHIFWFTEGKTHLTVVIYDVWQCYKGGEARRRFIEVEAEKGSAVTPEHGKKRVNAWVKEIQHQFDLSGEPLNESLYEIYSGKKYQLTSL